MEIGTIIRAGVAEVFEVKALDISPRTMYRPLALRVGTEIAVLVVSRLLSRHQKRRVGIPVEGEIHQGPQSPEIARRKNLSRTQCGGSTRGAVASSDWPV